MYNGIGLSSVRGTATSGHVQANAGHVRNSRHHHARTAGVFDPTSRGRSANSSAPLLTAEAIKDGQSSLALHEKKRRLEVRLLELRDRLEERGWRDEEIEREITKERKGTLDRWAREQEEEKRLVIRDAEKEGGDKDDQEQGIDESAEDASAPSRDGRDNHSYRDNYRGDYDRDRGRYQGHRYSDPRGRGGRGGNNAQQQQMFQEERNERLRDAFGISEKHHKEGAAFDRELIDSKRREKQQREEQNAKAKRKAERQQIRKEREEAKLKRREDRKREREEEGGKKAKRGRGRSRSRSASSDSRSSYSSSSGSSSSSSSRSSSSSYSSRSRSRDRRNKGGRSYSSSSSSSSSSRSRSASKDDSRKRSKKQSKRARSYSPESDRRSSRDKQAKSPEC
ncbi:hypothetical protein ACHAWO_011636 [Cyclotella atomus]|uniref:CWF21 domain-containing protein n=1 Tax=Cyclotella atomus TaxID=382360 RepID=A0ABD3NMB9_9STRA